MLTIFIGPNAVGKTNVVEGIQLMTALMSFRHASVEQLVRRGAASGQVSLRAQDGNRLLDLALSLVPEEHAKRYMLNGKAKRPSELRALIPSITFTPDDLGLVKGPASARRHALDVLGSQLNANYRLILKDYEKVLHHKNKMLKEGTSALLLDSIDEMVVTCGAQLTCYRAALFEKLGPHLVQRYEQISGGVEKLAAEFRPSWMVDGTSLEGEGSPRAATIGRDEAREALARALERRRGEEVARRRALVGPQADEINFSINDFAAAVYGSQGQQRSIVLAYKLAEAAVMEEVLGQKPVLLLDDVMSELDGARREALVSYIAHDVQTFITTANLDYFDEDMLAEARIVKLPCSEVE